MLNLPPRRCERCGKPYNPVRVAQRYCRRPCTKDRGPNHKDDRVGPILAALKHTDAKAQTCIMQIATLRDSLSLIRDVQREQVKKLNDLAASISTLSSSLSTLNTQVVKAFNLFAELLRNPAHDHVSAADAAELYSSRKSPY